LHGAIVCLDRDGNGVYGLLFARRQETRTEGDDESHVLIVERVQVNPPIDDSRFAMPATAAVVR
jgi:hypothetical protein